MKVPYLEPIPILISLVSWPRANIELRITEKKNHLIFITDSET